MESEVVSKESQDPIWIIIVPWIITGLSVVGTMSGHFISAYKDIEIKKYEVTFLEKRASYSTLMSEINMYFKTASPGKEDLHHISGRELEDKLYALEPFLTPTERERVKEKLEKIIFLINQHQEFLRERKAVDPGLMVSVIDHRDKIREILLNKLFDL